MRFVLLIALLLAACRSTPRMGPLTFEQGVTFEPREGLYGTLSVENLGPGQVKACVRQRDGVQSLSSIDEGETVRYRLSELFSVQLSRRLEGKSRIHWSASAESIEGLAVEVD